MRVSNKSKTLLPAALGLALLILDSRTAIEGAQAGVDVCIRSVLPTLFPFVFLSSALSLQRYRYHVFMILGIMINRNLLKD